MRSPALFSWFGSVEGGVVLDFLFAEAFELKCFQGESLGTFKGPDGVVAQVQVDHGGRALWDP